MTRSAKLDREAAEKLREFERLNDEFEDAISTFTGPERPTRTLGSRIVVLHDVAGCKILPLHFP